MNKSQALFESAFKAHHADDLAAAKTLYQKFLELDPTHAEAHNNLGVIFYKLNDFAAAQLQYTTAINLQPDYLQAHLNLAMLWLRQGETTKALQQFQQILQLDPQSTVAHYQLGNLYLAQGEIDPAVSHYNTVLKIQPEHVETLNNLGVAFLKQGRFDQATAYFNQALQFAPMHTDARSNLAATFLQQDRLSDAIWHYQLFLRLVPEDSDAHYNLGVAFMASGYLTEAIAEFEQVLKLMPTQVDACCNLGAIYLKMDNPQQAIFYYRKAIALRPKDVMVRYMLDALTQEGTPRTAPVEYIKNLFDNYAGYFDQHVTETLHYLTPQLIADSLVKYLPRVPVNWNVLDLGCGTGLSGVVFREIAKHLTGIDISPRMLNKARAKNIYDELIESDIVTALAGLVASYDLIIAADTLVYFGDLSAVFTGCACVLKLQGLLAFSVEVGKETDFQLQTTGRYTHSRMYIENLAKQHHFQILQSSEAAGRMQQGKPVSSFIFVLRKNQ